MPDPAPTRKAPQGRSGCALFMGVLLVGLGVLFLAQNLFELSLLGFFREALVLFSRYWPVLLVVWGVFKIVERFVAPERAQVSAFEIFLFVLIVGLGLSLRAARNLVDEVKNEVSLDEIFGVAGMELLGGPAHRFDEERTFDIGAATSLLVENSGGRVRATGWDEPTVRAVVTKRVRHAEEAEAARIAESVDVELSSRDGTARIRVVIPEESSFIETDLDLQVPRALPLTVRNRRGRVEAFGVEAMADLETSEGDVLCSNVKGGLKARTRHGDVDVDHVSGNVEIVNRDGAVTVRSVEGDLRAATSHDRLVAEDVTGSVALENRHAGVRTARIGGDVELRAENADVTVESAGGSVSLEASHRTVFVRGVGGRLTVTARNATIQAREIAGDAVLDDPNGEISVIGVEGSLRIGGRQSAVTVAEIGGPTEIESSQNDVRVSDFRSSLVVRSNHAAVRADASRLAGDVTLETTYGEVELHLPEGAPLRLEAQTRDGELRGGLEGLELRETDEDSSRRWEGTRGSGGPGVKVETTYADVILRDASRGGTSR